MKDLQISFLVLHTHVIFVASLSTSSESWNTKKQNISKYPAFACHMIATIYCHKNRLCYLFKVLTSISAASKAFSLSSSFWLVVASSSLVLSSSTYG